MEKQEVAPTVVTEAKPKKSARETAERVLGGDKRTSFDTAVIEAAPDPMPRQGKEQRAAVSRIKPAKKATKGKK